MQQKCLVTMQSHAFLSVCVRMSRRLPLWPTFHFLSTLHVSASHKSTLNAHTGFALPLNTMLLCHFAHTHRWDLFRSIRPLLGLALGGAALEITPKSTHKYKRCHLSRHLWNWLKPQSFNSCVYAHSQPACGTLSEIEQNDCLKWNL